MIKAKELAVRFVMGIDESDVFGSVTIMTYLLLFTYIIFVH